MRWVKLGTHIKDHVRFLEAGPIARDLYVWGLTYSGDHETDGELPRAAVLASSWGRGDRGNAKVAATLVRAGLWESIATGWRILRWAEQGNQTKAQLSAEREAARERKANSGSGKVRANSGRTNAEVPTSTSKSISESGSQIASEPLADSATPPPWFGSVLEVIEMNVGEKLHAGEAWLRYRGHRSKKGEPMSQHDAEYWLTTVMVREQKDAREEAHRRDTRDGERTKAIVAQRSGPEVKAMPSSAPLVRERERWEQEAGPPDPAAAARLAKLLGQVGT